MKQRRALAAACLFVGGFTWAIGPAQADVITLAPSSDTEIYSTGGTDRTKGDDTLLMVGADAGSPVNGPERRALFQFDLSSLPVNAQIQEATLRLKVAHVQDGNGDGVMNVHVHRLLKDWAEGGLAGSGYPSRATSWDYNFYEPSGSSNILWEVAGAGGATDRVGTPTATFNGFSGNEWKTADLTADVQAMVQGDLPNYGWLMVGPDAVDAGDRLRFRARENGTPQLLLEITYVIPEPATAAMGIVGAAFVLVRPSFGRRS